MRHFKHFLASFIGLASLLAIATPLAMLCHYIEHAVGTFVALIVFTIMMSGIMVLMSAYKQSVFKFFAWMDRQLSN